MSNDTNNQKEQVPVVACDEISRKAYLDLEKAVIARKKEHAEEIKDLEMRKSAIYRNLKRFTDLKVGDRFLTLDENDSVFMKGVHSGDYVAITLEGIHVGKIINMDPNERVELVP